MSILCCREYKLPPGKGRVVRTSTDSLLGRYEALDDKNVHESPAPAGGKRSGFTGQRTIITRILIATAIPVVVVLCLITLLIFNIIRTETQNYASEATMNFAEQLSVRISDQFMRMDSAILITRENLERLDRADPNVFKTADKLLVSMLLSVPGVYNVWFAFEPGVFSSREGYKNKRFTKSYILEEGAVAEIFDIPDDVLDSPERSPWFNIPLKTGGVYVEDANPYDYGDGQGVVYIGSINYPICMQGKTVGVLGIDLVYKRIFSFVQEASVLGEPARASLLSSRGQVLYSASGDRAYNRAPGLPPEIPIAHLLKVERPVIHSVSDPVTGEIKLVCLSPVTINESVEPILLRLELPGDLFMQRAMALLPSILLICALGIMVIVACVYFAARAIVRPIREITCQAEAIARGRLDLAFDAVEDGASGNEITQLASSLKKMLSELRQVHDLKLSAMTAELEQERMREAARTKNNFFAGMSHEIRTPMNAIIGFSDLLLTEPLLSRQRKHVQDIRISAVALLSLINDILDTSKMEAGKLELCQVSYDVREMLGNLRAIIGVMAGEKGLDFTCEIVGALPQYLEGDPERTRQILLNLLNNALKYTEQGGIRFCVAVEDETLLFEVSDSGIGIKEEVLPHIFEAFNQAPDQRIKQIEGTGLGLNIVHMLTRAMGGTIEVSSIYGEGSVFRVRLPLARGTAQACPSMESGRAGHYVWHAHSLVVDDNEINLSVAGSLLEHLGLSCDLVLSGKEAVSMAGEYDYDLIFMDHMMPGMDGIETTVAIRALGGHNATVTIIALTANAQPSAKMLFIDNGMNDMLAKPIDINSVHGVLERWLPREKRAGR